MPAVAAPERVAVAGAIGARAAQLQRALPWLGAAGVAAWFAFTPFVAEELCFELTPSQSG